MPKSSWLICSAVVWCAAVVWLGLAAAHAGAADGQSTPYDVVPPLALSGPRLHFHLGGVEANRPALSPILPDMAAYPASPWYLAQWQQSTVVRPDRMSRDDPVTRDPGLGVAAYGFEAPDGHAHLRIWRNGPGWVFELYERGGMVTAGGGSNLFLAVDATSPARLDRPTTYTLQARVSRASATYDTAQAEASGAVLAQIFSGFGLTFHDPAGAATQFVFLQLPLSSSRPVSRARNVICTLDAGGPHLLFAPSLHRGETVLPFRPAGPGMATLRYELQDYVRELVSEPYPCGERMLTWPRAARDLGNWTLGGLYVGLETENADLRAGAAGPGAQGTVEAALQVADIRLAQGAQ